MLKEIIRQTDRRTDRWTDRQTDRYEMERLAVRMAIMMNGLEHDLLYKEIEVMSHSLEEKKEQKEREIVHIISA